MQRNLRDNCLDFSFQTQFKVSEERSENNAGARTKIMQNNERVYWNGWKRVQGEIKELEGNIFVRRNEA